MGKRSQAQNCTHVDMDRVYGCDQVCCVCGCSPSLGFLYQCKQDSETDSLGSLRSRGKANVSPVKSRLRKELESAGLSESIILAAESGHYTNQQLQRLKLQKRELQNTIIDVQQADQANDAIARLMDMATAPCDTDGAANSLHIADTEPLGCTFKACHACRPYYLDRLYISFQAVVTAEIPPMTQADVAKLPVVSATIMRNISTRSQSLPSSRTPKTMRSTKRTLNSPATSASVGYSPSLNTTNSSNVTFKTTQTDIDEIAAQRRPRLNFYRVGSRPSSNMVQDVPRRSSHLTTQGFKTAVQGMFRSREPSSSGSSIACPSSISEFDTTDVRRVRRDKKHDQVKSATSVDNSSRVANQGSVDSFSLLHRDSGISTDSGIQLYSSEEDQDDRMQPRRPTARMHVPDVVAIKLPDSVTRLQKPGSVIKTREVVRGGKEHGNRHHVGLQSIMAQV